MADLKKNLDSGSITWVHLKGVEEPQNVRSQVAAMVEYVRRGLQKACEHNLFEAPNMTREEALEHLHSMGSAPHTVLATLVPLETLDAPDQKDEQSEAAAQLPRPQRYPAPSGSDGLNKTQRSERKAGR